MATGKYVFFDSKIGNFDASLKSLVSQRLFWHDVNIAERLK